MGFVDLHSHVLPALDDGSPDPATSLTMLRGLASLGFDVVCATPHQKAGQFMPTAEAIACAHRETAQAVAAAGVALRLALGAENMWDEVFYERTRSATVPSYDGGPAFLVELPIDRLPAGLFEELFGLRRRGALPVIAHPERYEPLWDDAAAIDRLAADNALVVDLGALAGYHGRRQMKMARRLVENGRAHAAASDAHSPGDVRSAGEGIAWLRKHLGPAGARRLLDENPRRILAGDLPEA